MKDTKEQLPEWNHEAPGSLHNAGHMNEELVQEVWHEFYKFFKLESTTKISQLLEWLEQREDDLTDRERMYLAFGIGRFIEMKKDPLASFLDRLTGEG